jgi:hypothetical protein
MYNHCSPNITNDINLKTHYTCFTLDELVEISKAFNQFIKKNKLCSKNGDDETIVCIPRKYIDYENKNRKQLWWSIYVRLRPICKYEYCWIDLDFVKKISDKNLREKIKYFTFKPKMTKTPYTWLSTNNINQVMQQYQEYDKNFKFLGALPSNFYKISDFDYNEILDYKKFGIIFNLDNHDQKGSHWVSFLIDNQLKTIEYFDSVADPPNKNIKTFIKNVYLFLKKNDLHYRYKQNKNVHQKENTECGVFSIYYIIQRLSNNTFENITKNIINDDDMNKFRNVIFRPRHL